MVQKVNNAYRLDDTLENNKIQTTNQSKSISDTKMGAQGDQSAPKAPKLKAEAAQSLPKIAQGDPKTPKVVQKASKSGPIIRPN